MGTRRFISLVVDAGGNLVAPDDARVTEDTVVVFVFVNEHPTNVFKVEFNNFRIKETLAPAQILQSAGHQHQLQPGDVKVTKERTKPNFGAGAGNFPYTTYKYDVTVTDVTAGTPGVTLDPDFDVPPP